MRLIGPEQPGGGILHLTGQGPNGGWRVIEVWDAEEKAQRFFEERCLPSFEAVGVPEPTVPQVAGPQLHRLARETGEHHARGPVMLCPHRGEPRRGDRL